MCYWYGSCIGIIDNKTACNIIEFVNAGTCYESPLYVVTVLQKVFAT
jgi:hypothetical protein